MDGLVSRLLCLWVDEDNQNDRIYMNTTINAFITPKGEKAIVSMGTKS